MTAPLRLFFALPLPAALTARIAAWAEGLKIPPAPADGGGGARGGGRGGARGGKPGGGPSGSAAAAATQRGPVRVPASHMHITLAFLGAVQPSSLSALEKVGEAAAAAAASTPTPTPTPTPTTTSAETTAPAGFEVKLDSLGCWRNGVLHLAPRGATPPPLVALVSALQAALAAEGFPVERRPFRPHVTLARRAAPTYPPRALRPDFTFRADRVTLFASHSTADGVVYEPLREWLLPPPVAASAAVVASHAQPTHKVATGQPTPMSPTSRGSATPPDHIT